ncbi:MAG TPA: nuclear transport factor 2 family protein [Candidatus Binataceae bacterium]|nr:nuclear transport factor 2 family protein [Candidatus Binataceae bacterium]
MTPAEQKERAVELLKQLENPDIAKLESMVADNFEWRVMTRMPGFAPMKGKDALKGFAKGLKAMMPNGVNMKFGVVFSEGNNVSVQCESNTTAANGRKYNNLYNFYIRFAGDKIDQVLEYCDTNHAREVFVA